MTTDTPVEGYSKDERMWGMICHLAALAGFVGIPLGNVLGPLIVWLIKREEFPLVADQGKESLNFQISMTIYGVICIPLMFVVIGFLLGLALLIADVVFIIIAAMKANEGALYRYPLTIRLIKSSKRFQLTYAVSTAAGNLAPRRPFGRTSRTGLARETGLTGGRRRQGTFPPEGVPCETRDSDLNSGGCRDCCSSY